MSRTLDVDVIARQYLVAKRVVVDAGFASEIGWQALAASSGVTARSFVEEAAWVIMSAGFSERAVRRRFPLVSSALFDFDLARVVGEPSCRDAALTAFAHEAKVDAILAIAAWAHAAGDDTIGNVVARRDESTLMQLPYIGPVTVRHLLKNLGAPIAKPDRHLVRFASRCGWPVDELCDAIARRLSEPIAVVDIVLWRWSALHATECRDECDGLPHHLTALRFA
jgi:hypothetical protein